MSTIDNPFNFIERFEYLLKNELQFAIPVAAIKVLIEVIEKDTALTMSELMNTLENVISQLKTVPFCNTIPVSAGCDLFQRFITRSSPGFTEFSLFKAHLINRGNQFCNKAATCRDRIANLAIQFIKDDSVILIHSFSRVVMSALQLALSLKKRFKVYVTESRPTSAGYSAVKALTEAGINATLILDVGVGYIMDQVDLVLVGAEGVVENGGLINQVGTYQLSIIAKANNVPFYCLAESFKFVRLFPLNQSEVPLNLPEIRAYSEIIKSDHIDHTDITGIMVKTPSLDYTPPSYISLLVTDLGVLTPSGVSDELVKLYF
ncbi:nagb/rpia/CoA transferase-like protein [Neoconidiobolus thromboides FSU 785]|nr:nagb/rpia/CoA transferase-like protein [Neoconidiobolus thromboides FSU 785]